MMRVLLPSDDLSAIAAGRLARIQRVLQLLRGNQLPCFMNMDGQLFIADSIQLDAYPAAHANIRRPVEFFRVFFDQHFLNANRRGYRDRNMSVVVMIVGKHREDFLLNEPGRFAVR